MRTKNIVAKKVLCIMLSIVFMLSGECLGAQINSTGIGTVQAQAATVRLNRKNCVLDIGKTIDLKILGTKKKPRWYTSNKNVATVSSTGHVVARKKGDTVIAAQVGVKKYKCKIVVSAKRSMEYASRALIDGKYVYLGVDYYANKTGGIFKYNVETGKKTKISSLWNWNQLTMKGEYLYTDVADNRGGKYIYKLSKDGRYKKNLGRGIMPFIIGNSIYYVGHTTQGPTEFGEYTGIYRMDLNGNNKKCLYKKKTNEYVTISGIYNNRLVVYRDRTEYLMDASGYMKKVNISRSYANCNMGLPKKEFYDSSRMLYVSANTYGYRYFISDGKLIKKKGNSECIVHTFKQPITTVVDMDAYILVWTYGYDNNRENYGWRNLYIVSPTNHKVKGVMYNVGGRDGL